MMQLYSKQVPFNRDAFFAAYKRLSKWEENHVLLESGRGGRYSICGISPAAILEGTDTGLEIRNRQGESEYLSGDPLLLMKDWMGARKMEHRSDLPDFQGGAIGFISYDYARSIEKLPSMAEDDLRVPALYFMVFDEIAVFDHHSHILYLMKIGNAKEQPACFSRLNEMEMLFTSHDDEERVSDRAIEEKEREISVSMTEKAFIDAVKRIQAYIAAGDLFQVNLSVRRSQPLISQPLDVYEQLRTINPSPYMSYLHSPSFQVASGSPELLVKKKGNQVSTRPIAGTRSRGMSAEEDAQLVKELLENEKERAEHVMLVDLERNDLGRVCAYGTVEVDEFMAVEKYSHVMHIVSNVKGLLAEQYDGYDAIRAVFPGGTITGAPKVRTMEVIEELEPVRRGIYTGSIGWIGFDEDLELNIVIRTLFVKEGVGHIQAGAGVVVDSKPIYEYKESLKKAAALWKAVEMANEQAEAGVDDDSDDR
ncbi:anthranilate synthase component I family protein [Bacillus sp. 1P06AnD]|uniref:anthranilate synthase component I family protein n=1 Tax=Bacillus sp. 1P06AnD TaxID=3132208 RepID=UPI0039A041B2